MVELTDDDAANLGRGVGFDRYWDFESRAGSFGLIDGVELLGRDLAFATSRELDRELGDLLTPEDREEIRMALDRAVSRDDRVETVERPIEVEAAGDDTPATAEVRVTIVAATGERGEGVLPVV